MAATVVLDEYYFAITAIITIGFQLAGFFVAYTFQFDKVTDFSGSTNFILLAVLSLVLSGTYHPRQVMLTVMLIVSRLWLAGFLLYRVLQRGHDARFDEMRSKFFAFLGFWVFQMLWVWLVSMPVVFVNSRTTQPDLGPLDYAGLAIFVVGLLFEVGGDMQKLFFKARTDSHGRHPMGGLYACMRHPNYTGEMALWIGTFVSASAAFAGHEAAGWSTLLSPGFTVLILLFLSGMPSAEGNAQLRFMKTPSKRAEYEAYRERTSPIIPVPPQLYVCLPRLVKQLFCCEFPMYEVSSQPEADSDGEGSSLRKAGPPAEAVGAAATPATAEAGGTAVARSPVAGRDVANPIPDGEGEAVVVTGAYQTAA